MPSLEVKIAKSNSELKMILKNVEDEGTGSLLDILKQAKEETNQFLTTLVDDDKLVRATVIKQAGKRKSCEELEGIWIWNRIMNYAD